MVLFHNTGKNMGVGQNMLFELAEFHLAALVPGIMLSHCHGLLGHLNATETCYQPHLYFPYNDKRNPAVKKGQWLFKWSKLVLLLCTKLQCHLWFSCYGRNVCFETGWLWILVTLRSTLFPLHKMIHQLFLHLHITAESGNLCRCQRSEL